jgi:acyl phosphate:glycerol-3-phosphate acyltransferase
MSWEAVLARLLAAYLLGSLSGSLILGRLRGVDVRKLGSGNAGGTNAFRTQGWRFALVVVLIDVGKAMLAVWWAQRGVMDEGVALRIGVAAGAAAVLGHVWPIFFGFKGGKGAATLIGALAMLWPLVLLPLVLVWLLVMLCTGYVGFATMLAGVAMIPVVLLADPGGERLLWLVVALAIAGFLIFTHRANIQRMRAGSENRFEGIRVIGRWFERRR